MEAHLTSRRMFLRGAGGLLAIPFLSSLVKSAHAATASPKYVHINSNLTLRRALTYPLYDHPYPSYPQPPGTTPNSVPWITKDLDTTYQSLKDIVAYQGKLSFTLDEKWNPFTDRMLLVTNAHAYVGYNNHNCGISSACSNGGSGPLASDPAIHGPLLQHGYSADWLIEQAWARSSPTQLSALRVNLGDAADLGYETFCFGLLNGTPARIPMMQSLGELGARVVGTQDVTAADRANRSSRIDSVLDDYKSLMNHRRISSLDKQRLSAAAEMWHTIGTGLQAAGTGGSCTFPSIDPTVVNWGDRHRTALDVVAMALACGVTRTVAYGLIQGGDAMNDQLTMHGWEHDSRVGAEVDPSVTDPYFGMIRWRSDLVTYFLSKLDSLKDEAGGSLLGSSLVVWAHQYADSGHALLGHPLIAVGGAAGKLETGWHVDAGAAPINRFHLTNMMAMGLPLADIEKSGKAGFGEVAQPYNTGDNNAVITGEQDAKSDDPSKRHYDTSKMGYFSSDSEMRKPFPYLLSH
jgi:hypothetical protein